MFDFVLESYTLQVLPSGLRPDAARCISSFLAPGGILLVIALGREPSEPEGMMPWPLGKEELSLFKAYGLQEIAFEDCMDREEVPVRRCVDSRPPIGEKDRRDRKSMAHEFDGQKYEAASGHQKEWGERLIAELNLRGSERILDLGCGDGALTVQLSRLVPNGMVVGIDASVGMIEAAKRKQGKNVRFLLMDIDNLEFDQEFDVVFSNATLHWVNDHRRLFKRAQRVLSQAGALRFNFAGDGNCSSFIKVIRESIALPLFSKYFKGFVWPWYMPSVEEYRTLVQGAGFQDTDVWGENADRFFPDADAMIKWIDQPSLVPFMVCVAEQHKALFREFVVRRMIEETEQADGRCFETFRRINVHARK